MVVVKNAQTTNELNPMEARVAPTIVQIDRRFLRVVCVRIVMIIKGLRALFIHIGEGKLAKTVDQTHAQIDKDLIYLAFVLTVETIN